MANNPEHSKNIYDLNTEQGKKIISDRFKAIEQYGTLQEQDLPDVKQDIYFQKMASIKGKHNG